MMTATHFLAGLIIVGTAAALAIPESSPPAYLPKLCHRRF
jgi:hypothetical protein